MSSPSRIGVFGGTFNPIHVCHLRIAARVLALLALDRVVFVPASVPPHKAKEDLAPAQHRLEMVRLSHAGWSAPQIARHLGLCEKRVRHWIKTFLNEGFDALPDRPHPGPQSALTPAKEEASRQQLRQEPRTWTAGQLAEWVAQHLEVRLSADRLARRLKRARITYKRSRRSVKHKQKPEEVAAKKAEMAAQEKRGAQARSM